MKFHEDFLSRFSRCYVWTHKYSWRHYWVYLCKFPFRTRQQISNHACLQTNRLTHVFMVSMYVTHRHVVNKKFKERVSSKYFLFSHKGLWTFCQAFRSGVSKQRALPTSSRVILSYHSLQMTRLCRTTYETWFHAVTIAGFYTSVPEGES